MNKDQWFGSLLSLAAVSVFAAPASHADSMAALQATSEAMTQETTEATIQAGSQASTEFLSLSGRQNNSEAGYEATGPVNMNFELLRNPEILIPPRPFGWGSKGAIYAGGTQQYSDGWGSNVNGYLTPRPTSAPHMVPGRAVPGRIPRMRIQETGVPLHNFRLANLNGTRVAPTVIRSRTETLVQTEGPSINRKYAYVRTSEQM